MFLSAKKLAFLGLLLACTVIIVILSGVLEFNSLFLLAGASYLVGIAIREGGIRIGTGFYIASLLLSLMLAPNKLYCITFIAMGLYLVISEYIYDKLAKIKRIGNRKRVYWIIKYVIFNLMYIPMLIFLPKLIYQGELNDRLWQALIPAGQVALFVYDRAYNYFQKHVWEKVRGKLNLL
ncbi:MAG TPA: hypothetical protein VJZ06_10570 [Mobilitalea sp.]|nr:hypothetical protein [Mobilitalea sp.]